MKLSDVFFVDAEHGWVLGAPLSVDGQIDGFILRTDDRGETWDKVVVPGSGVPDDLSFVDAMAGWVVGQRGVILRTEDGGRTWTSDNPGMNADLYSVSFTDASHGWAVGEWGTVLTYSTGPYTAPFSDTRMSQYRHHVRAVPPGGAGPGHLDGGAWSEQRASWGTGRPR